MTGRWMVTLVIIVMLGIMGASLWLAVSVGAQGTDASGGGETATSAAQEAVTGNPVVAVIAYQSETEYEPDPFEPDRLRRAKTEVKQLILVRADGTIEHKRAW